MIRDSIQRMMAAGALGALVALSCARGETETVTPAPDAPVELAPGLRVDAAKGVVEFDGKLSPMIRGGVHGHDRFLLEQFVCLAGTKDHESLVVTDVKPSAIHAALLAAGAEAGKPVTWVTEGEEIKVVPPEGAKVEVAFVMGDAVIDPRTWAVDADTQKPIEGSGWVFAGSNQKSTPQGHPFYEADAAGTLIGLAGFGSETIAWADPISDQEDEGELEWVAADAAKDHAGEAVVVRITIVPAEAPAAPAAE